MSAFFDNVQLIDQKNISLFGMTDEFFCAYLKKNFDSKRKSIVVLTSTLYEANRLFNIMCNYTNDVLFFPMDDFVSSYSIASSPELKINRLEVLNSLLDGLPKVIFLHLNSLLKPLPSKNKYVSEIISLSKGDVISRDDLVSKLLDIGYVNEVLVTKTGDVGIRGYIIDIFPVFSQNPFRIEFFDNEIEMIRQFDINTQKSIGEVNSIKIYPNIEYIGGDFSFSIFDYIGSDYDFFIKDYTQIKAAYDILLNDVHEYIEKNSLVNKENLILNFDDFLNDKIIYYNTVDNFSVSSYYDFGVRKIDKFGENFEVINEFLSRMIADKYTVILSFSSCNKMKIVEKINLSYCFSSLDNLVENAVNVVDFSFTEGFIYKNYVIISEYDIFNTKKSYNYKTKFRYSSKVKDYNALNVGDYVVHNKYGIGIYNGLKTLKKGEYLKDYVEVLYAGSDKLYIPVEKIDLLSKYSAREGVAPKIYKLDSVEWEKTKRRVQGKVRETAFKLVKLYASRKMQKGFAFSKDNELQEVFDSEFEYQLTQDQETAIKQIKTDMESEYPMDRLLCGDVGYGKTEVAFQAMFKAVLDSKQVLYLCPTTILSKQQYKNALIRFKNYPVNIAVLNRFSTPKEVGKIVEGLQNGKIDILFGTHRILSDDIKPLNLGLLVVDEEQRFGVMHKEKMKELKNNVDVLSLSATPIPRTLQMSLSGIRSLSLIETPPVNRYPVETYVIAEDELVIRNVIYKEMSREGQVYYLYNNVQSIERERDKLVRLVPEARIVIAHGQMSKIELEGIMEQFVNHEYDVLLCTTIIETGIDIANVNTLIVIDADKFGLSQLYQIRGRVGRTDKIAYAYLMYKKDKVLTQTALKRLDAIKQFTELGSGFAIASRDLSIRGAGDLLGSEQAGFIDNIGIELYLKILNDEIRRLNGEEVALEDDSTDHPLLEVETHIADEYVSDTSLKLEIHKIINSIDSYEKLCEVKDILEDRFGQLSDSINIYMYEEWFEKLASELEIINVKDNKYEIEMMFSSNITERIDVEELFYDAFRINSGFKFKSKGNSIVISLIKKDLQRHYLFYLIDLLLTVKFKKD